MDAKARDAMVKRATEALKKWPTFEDLPATKKKHAKQVEVQAGDQQNYVQMMYEVCARHTPVGRHGNAIVGE